MPVTLTTPTSPIPDVWVLPVASPKNVGLVPADIGAVVGEFTRGPVDIPIFVGTMNDAKNIFGGPIAQTANPLKLLSGWPSLLSMVQQGLLNKYVVRVCGAQARAGYVTIKVGATAAYVLHAATPGSWANGSLQALVRNGALANTWDLIVTNNATGERDTVLGLPTLAGTDATTSATVINRINAVCSLVTASQPVVDPITTATTYSTSGTGSTFPGGVGYYLVWTYTTAAGGETTPSPENAVTVSPTAGQNITFSVTLPAGANGVKVYTSTVSGNEVFAYAQTGTGTFTVTITNPAALGTTATAPRVNNAQTGVGSTAGAPIVSGTSTTYVFPSAYAAGAGKGDDGQGADVTRYIGAEGTPNVGVYSLAQTNPKPSFVVLAQDAGCNTAFWQLQADLAFKYNWTAVVGLPQGTSVSAAIAAMATGPVTGLMATPGSNQRIKIAYPWVQIYDSEIFKTAINVAPQAHFAAITAIQDANTSAGNKPLAAILGPEYALTRNQMEQLTVAGINPIGPTLSGGYGFMTDKMLSQDDGFAIRMQSLIAAGFLLIGAPFVQVPNTPRLRARAQTQFREYLDTLADQGLIPENAGGAAPTLNAPVLPSQTAAKAAAGQPGALPSSVQTGTSSSGSAAAQANYAVICDESNNVSNGVTSRFLVVDCQIRLYPNTDYVLIRAAIATDVVITLNSTATAA